MKNYMLRIVISVLFIIPLFVFCLFSCAPENPEPTVQTPRIYLSSVNLSLDVAATHQLTVSKNSIVEETAIKWTSSSPEVATCEGGLVTAIAPGTTRISAEAEGAVTAYCVVTVSENVKRLVNVERIVGPVYLEYTDPATGRLVAFDVTMTLYDPNDSDEPHFKCQFNPYQENTVEIRVSFSAKKLYDSAGDFAKTPFTYYLNLYKENGEFCETQSPEKNTTAIAVGESANYVMVFNAYIMENPREFSFVVSSSPHSEG